MNIFKAWVEISRLFGRIAAVSGIHTENSPCFHQFARHKMFPFSTCPECPCLHRTGHLSPCQLRLVLGSQTNAFWEAQPRCCLAGSASQCCHFGHWIVPCTQRSRAHRDRRPGAGVTPWQRGNWAGFVFVIICLFFSNCSFASWWVKVTVCALSLWIDVSCLVFTAVEQPWQKGRGGDGPKAIKIKLDKGASRLRSCFLPAEMCRCFSDCIVNRQTYHYCKALCRKHTINRACAQESNYLKA